MTANATNHHGLHRHRRLLRAWLHEWNLELALRKAGDHDPGDQGSAASRPAAPVSLYPQEDETWPGRILLLRPASEPQPWPRPFYVLVLSKTAAGDHEAAPFGRFSTPALPGEWRTGSRAKPLRVLCLWNARLLPRRLLESAWPAGRLRADKLKKALAIRQGLARGHGAPAAPGLDAGPPLLHPRDPRWDYVAEEQDLWDEFIGQTGSCELPGASDPGNRGDYERPPEVQRWAAEPPDREGKPMPPG